MADTSDLAIRIKGYETSGKLELDPTLPIVIRLDGNSFSKFTKRFNKPFDRVITSAMEEATKAVFDRISNVKIGYTQSDEITLILLPTKDGVLGNRIDKICSLLAARCSNIFNDYLRSMFPDEDFFAEFDCRAFNVPSLSEAKNALLWRQFDCWKNYVGVVAHHKFGTKKLHKKNTSEKIAMLKEFGIDVYTDFNEKYHYGLLFFKTKKLVPIPEEYKSFPQNVGKTHIERSHFSLETGLISNSDLFEKVMTNE